MPRMVKPVNPDLHCAKALHVIDLQTSRHELPGHFAANIVLHALRQRRSPKRHAALIVVEFHILREERGKLRQIAPVVGIKQDRKSTRLNSSHGYISYAVFCLKKKNT